MTTFKVSKFFELWEDAQSLAQSIVAKSQNHLLCRHCIDVSRYEWNLQLFSIAIRVALGKMEKKRKIRIRVSTTTTNLQNGLCILKCSFQ